MGDDEHGKRRNGQGTGKGLKFLATRRDLQLICDVFQNRPYMRRPMAGTKNTWVSRVFLLSSSMKGRSPPLEVGGGGGEPGKVHRAGEASSSPLTEVEEGKLPRTKKGKRRKLRKWGGRRLPDDATPDTLPPVRKAIRNWGSSPGPDGRRKKVVSAYSFRSIHLFHGLEQGRTRNNARRNVLTRKCSQVSCDTVALRCMMWQGNRG